MRLSHFIHAHESQLASDMARLAHEIEESVNEKGVIPAEGALQRAAPLTPEVDQNPEIEAQRKGQSAENSAYIFSGATSAGKGALLARLVGVSIAAASRDSMLMAGESTLAKMAGSYQMLPSRSAFLTVALASVIDGVLSTARREGFTQTQNDSLSTMPENSPGQVDGLPLAIANAFSDGTVAAPFVAQLASIDFLNVDELNTLLKAVFNFAQEAVAEIAKALAKGYVTFLNQVEENYDAFVSLLDTISSPAGFKISAYLLELDMPEGPRTPSFNLPILGAGIDGDTNTIRFLDVSNLSAFGSITEKGDPSDTNPDSNDIAGQVEVDIAGMLVGANFQNGLYVGAYTAETDDTEAHHVFQTGMVDQSGPYAFGERLDSLNAISISPESDAGTNGLILGDLIPLDLSVEGISAFLDSQEREYTLPKTDFKTYEEILDGVINSAAVKPEDLGWELDPSFTNAEVFESIDLDSILAVASKVELASNEATSTLLSPEVLGFDVASYLGGLKGLDSKGTGPFGSSALGEGSVL